MDITQIEHERGLELSQITVLHIPHSSRHVPVEERQVILFRAGLKKKLSDFSQL